MKKRVVRALVFIFVSFSILAVTSYYLAKNNANKLYDMPFTCDICGKTFVEYNVPSGYSKEMLQLSPDDIYIMVCPECLGKVRAYQTGEYGIRKTNLIKDIKIKLNKVE